MNIHSAKHPPGTRPIACHIANALREVAIVVARLEDASLQMPLCGPNHAQKTKTLQDFDLILQSLSDLAGLLDALGKHGPARMVAEQDLLIADMRLAWLRDLIGGTDSQPDHDTTRILIF